MFISIIVVSLKCQTNTKTDMKTVNLLRVIELAAQHHSTRLTINQVRPDQSVSNAIPIVVHNCVPSFVDSLNREGFTLSMGDEGMHVNDLFVDPTKGN